ncbi:uncharacterized protein METZ01_LOCUS204894 [marine metagenome]|uniref:Uncharacterized protein n=1 Tax=marine metagenome TaxID=408172 RepID=A0A382EMU6_9ZZZZ
MSDFKDSLIKNIKFGHNSDKSFTKLSFSFVL